MRLIFERYDRNHNGRLDHGELREALGAFGKGGMGGMDGKGGEGGRVGLGLGLDVTSREAAERLNKYDRDKSGAIEIDEFATLVADLRRSGYEIRDAELSELRARSHRDATEAGVAADIRAAFERYNALGLGLRVEG